MNLCKHYVECEAGVGVEVNPMTGKCVKCGNYPESLIYGDPEDIDGPEDDEWINTAYYNQYKKGENK